MFDYLNALHESLIVENELRKRKLIYKETPNVNITEKIEQLIQKIIQDIIENKEPSISFPRRTWENVSQNELGILQTLENHEKTTVSLGSSSSIRNFAMIIRILNTIFELLSQSKHTTKRDIYYGNVALFENQRNSDEAIDTIACMFQVPRNTLNIIASHKGVVAGSLTFRDAGNFVDCRDCTIDGKSITPFTENITELETDAKFILIVEKDTIFQRIVNDKLFQKLPCILVTGKGVPDLATRSFLKKLEVELSLPIFALVDADPYGIEILHTYKYGSLNMVHDAHNIAISSIRWIGIHRRDFGVFRIPESTLIPMTEQDKSKARSMLQRTTFEKNKEWIHELESMLNSGTKAEIECLAYHSLSFLTETYIPTKIAGGCWI